MPPNIKTVNMLFGTNITKKEEMVAWLNKRRPSSGEITCQATGTGTRVGIEIEIQIEIEIEMERYPQSYA